MPTPAEAVAAPEVDLETLPLQELRELMMKNGGPLGADPAPQADPDPQPRTEDGKFASKEPVEDPPQVFRREIDLGDGSGKQVFEADSAEDLIEKLAEAQKHATKKIREQAQALKAAEKPPEPEKEPQTVAELYQKVKAMEEDRQWQDTQLKFVQNTPDYLANEINGKKMVRYMKAEGIPQTLEGLQQAFTELSESGLLETAAVAEPDDDKDPNKGGLPPQTAPAPAGTRKKAASGLPARDSLSRRAAKVAPDAKDLETMDINELRKLTKAAFES